RWRRRVGKDAGQIGQDRKGQHKKRQRGEEALGESGQLLEFGEDSSHGLPLSSIVGGAVEQRLESVLESDVSKRRTESGLSGCADEETWQASGLCARPLGERDNLLNHPRLEGELSPCPHPSHVALSASLCSWRQPPFSLQRRKSPTPFASAT